MGHHLVQFPETATLEYENPKNGRVTHLKMTSGPNPQRRFHWILVKHNIPISYIYNII